MSKRDQETITREVDCIFHCGLSTKADENLKQSILINIVATRDLLSLAKKMEQLSVSKKPFLKASEKHEIVCVLETGSL